MDNIYLLSVINWFHILATSFWIGGMAFNIIVLMPAVKKTIDASIAGKLMASIMGRFRTLAYISMTVLVLTGAILTRSYDSYMGITQSFSAIAVISLIKHIVIVITGIIALYAFEGLRRKVAKVASRGPSAELALLQKKQIGFAAAGFVLGIVILLLSGIMRALS